MSKNIAKMFENVPLAPLCSFKAGGVARFFVEPTSVSDVQKIMRFVSESGTVPVFLGGGSNVLLADIDGIVILSRAFRDIVWKNEVVEVESGYPLRGLVREALLSGLSGLEFAVGIPGSVGGAVVGNAGAQNESMSGVLLWAEFVDENGELLRLASNDIESGYRFSALSLGRRFLTKCAFSLKKIGREEVRKHCLSFWSKRASQPFSAKSAGCMFKNPAGDFAGRLLDECGCKGMSIGDAEISRQHANFLVNVGNADVRDIKALMDKCREIVHEKTGILLDFEVKMFGF